MNELSLDCVCGQLLVVGFDGTELGADLQEDLRAGRRGGVILFKRNVPSVETTRTLTAAVGESCPADLPPFIGIDQEGGRVSRLPPPFVTLPPMRELGAAGDRDRVRSTGKLIGAQLAALGFNINFAPVLDVDTNPKNPVIGDRAFSSDPDHVARFGRALAEGQREGGVMSCGKHFPGHGDTAKDSHHDLPVVKHGRERLDRVELPPFRAAALSGIEALMSAHVVFEELDAGIPATLSRFVCTTLLRGELGFRGVLFSDDLEMKALAARAPIEQNAVRAVRAGCDALLVCHDPDLQTRAHAALVAEAERDSSFADRCREAAARGLAARRARPPAPAAPAALDAVLADAARVA